MGDVSGTLRLRCERLVTPEGVVEPALVTVTDGYVTAIASDGPDEGGLGDGEPEDGGLDEGDAELLPGWIVPGFVDTHVHGGGGADYATTDPVEALRGRRFHLAHGTTSSLASLVTADLESLLAQIATLVPLVESGDFTGLHLEGPFLSAAKAGAHEPSLLRDPDPEVLDQLLEAGQGTIAMVTLAPELPGALAAIERLVGAGVVVAVGHTDGDATMVGRALDAGASAATHLFNAMRPLHHREPGPVPLLLSDPRAVVELICDGFHLHPDVVAMAVAAAGPDRVALVTDAMTAAGAADGDYRLGHLQVRVERGQARLVGADGQPGSIAGSTLTMADAFAFVVAAGATIPEAARMAATTPARLHRVDSVGEIRVGARADLCVVDDEGRLQRVLRRGEWVPALTPA